MEHFDLDTFMRRVDATKTATELADLQAELLRYSQSLSESDRADLVSAYTDRMSQRHTGIKDRLTNLENAHANA